MKSLFTTLLILAGLMGYGQTLTGISFYDLDKTRYTIGNIVNPNYVPYQGDSIWVEITLEHNSQLDFPIVVRIDSLEIINTNLQGWVNNNTIFKIKVPRLIDKKYDKHDIYFNDTYYKYFIFKRSETLSIADNKELYIEFKYFDLFGNEIKNPVNGVYIYRTNTGEIGKIFIP